MKVYVASPFFNDYERKVRDLMALDYAMENGGTEFLRPDKTEASKNYAVCDIKDRKEWAKKVFHENLRMIEECDALLFPKFTNDIGTLFEVGYALAKGKNIIRYDYLRRKSVLIDTTGCIRNIPKDDTIMIDGQISAVKFGFMAARSDGLRFIMKNGIKPNVMFSANYTEVDEDGNVKEQDWEKVL